MDDVAARSDLIALADCPLCKKQPGQKVGPPAMVRCVTKDCEGSKQAAETVEAWNARLAASQPDRSKNWTLVDGTMTTGESVIFDGSFIIAKVTRREDAEFILSLLSGAVTKSDGDQKSMFRCCAGTPDYDCRSGFNPCKCIQPAPSDTPIADSSYRDVIDEALVIRHLGVAKGDARAELENIISWEVSVALDPAVSSSAQALIDQGKSAALFAPVRDPVAWQYRHKLPNSAWSEWQSISQDTFARLVPNAHLQTRMLYAHPPAPAVGEPSREAVASMLARMLYNDATLDNCTESERESWLTAADAIRTMYRPHPPAPAVEEFYRRVGAVDPALRSVKTAGK